MLSYRIDCQGDDGSWSAHEFMAVDDDHAIAHALRVRTANTSELYQASRWLATFDRAPELRKSGSSTTAPKGERYQGELQQLHSAVVVRILDDGRLAANH